MKQATKPGRVLPPNFKYVLEQDSLRRLTWRERVTLLLFGMNILVKVKVLTEHKVGRYDVTKTELMLTHLEEPPQPEGDFLPEYIQIPRGDVPG